MSITLTNVNMSARIAKMGAEIKSLKENLSGKEYIWQSDPAHWNGAAPILFPIVAGLKDGKCTIGGKTYSIPPHGFVRKKEWELVSSSNTCATFQTLSDETTREMYPFEFVLQAHFELETTGLSVTYEVSNKSSGKMYFSIGSHPAFNLPFAGGSIENYYFHFSEPENLQRYFLEGVVHLKETEPVFDNSHQIFLTRQLFDRGAIILKHPVSKSVTIMNSKNSKRIRVMTDGMPFLGLWSKPNAAPFVCIEPWFGIPDPIDSDQRFETKEGIMSLETGGTFKSTYRIDIMDGPE